MALPGAWRALLWIYKKENPCSEKEREKWWRLKKAVTCTNRPVHKAEKQLLVKGKQGHFQQTLEMSNPDNDNDKIIQGLHDQDKKDVVSTIQIPFQALLQKNKK